jgi:PAS domain S-box-containing protein
MTTAFDESEASGGLADSVRSRHLLRVVADSMLDPQVLLEAVRDSQGQVVDFLYVEVNRATCEYLGASRDELLGHRLLSKSPGIAEAGLLADYVQCLDTGEPVEHDDFTDDNEILADTRHYDIRAGRATSTAISLTWRDVTERFQMAREATRADTLFRRSMASAAVGMFLADLEGNFVEVNNALCGFFGYDADTLQGKTWQELTAADYLEADLDKRDEVLAGDIDSYRMVKQFIHAGGGPIWGDLAVSCVRGDDGQLETFIGQITDITEQVAGRAKLQEAQRQQALIDARYRRSIDNAAVGMCMINPQGRLQDVNAAMCNFLGSTAEEMIGKHWRDVTEREYVEEEQRNWDGIVDGRTDSYRMIKHYNRADGQIIWGDLTVSGIRDDNGHLEQCVALLTDITARVEAAERNRALLELIQQQSNRLNSELHSAAAYVSSILPGDLAGPVRVSSRYLPSQQLAGDIFDYRWIDDDHLFVYLIDVSGHGIRPALLSVSVHNLLRSGSLPPATLLTPGEVLAELNRRFQMGTQDGNYLTMWCGVYELSTRTLRYANSGAPPAFAINPDATTATELATDGQPLGMFEDNAYTSRTYPVPPGCSVLIFSDGAYESGLDHGHQLSVADFNKLFTRLAASPLDDLVETLRGLTPTGTFDDDCTLVNLVFD